MKKVFLAVFAAAALALMLPEQLHAETPPEPVVASVIVTEMKLGGDSLAGEPREFVTLFNQTDKAIHFGTDGRWRLEYAKDTFDAANCGAASWEDTAGGTAADATILTGTLQPGEVLSVEPALTDDRDGSLRVVEQREAFFVVHDLVGWGEAAPCFETAAAQKPSTGTAPGESLRRYLGCEFAKPVDTDDNATDFFIAPEPAYPGLGNTLLPSCESDSGQPPACKGIIISEILPNAAGADSGNEFIELYNPTTKNVMLDGCGLQVGTGNIYWFEDGIELAPEAYRAFYDGTTDLTLPNAAGGTVYLLANRAAPEELQQVSYEPGLDDDAAWAWFGGDTWEATYTPTPQALNISQPTKTCPTGKERNPNTGRCRSIGTSGNDGLKPCGPGRERNPETNRCRKIDTGPQFKPCGPGRERNPETNRCRSTNSGASLKPCSLNEERNPATNRCRNIGGGPALKPCGPNQERNPDTNRCRTVAGANTAMLPEVHDIQAVSEGTPYRWWVIGGAAALAAAYGIYEWRRDIAALLAKRKANKT